VRWVTGKAAINASIVRPLDYRKERRLRSLTAVVE
jgi:hypothetical protein